jgi:cation transport regulator ChaC
MNAPVFEFSEDVRPNMKLTIRRYQTYTAPRGEDPGNVAGYNTDLVCCGRSMNIAHVQTLEAAKILLHGWVREMDRQLAVYEVQQHLSVPKSVRSPEQFAQAILTSPIYREKYKDNE